VRQAESTRLYYDLEVVHVIPDAADSRILPREARRAPDPKRRVTIGETAQLITDPIHGAYPHGSPHRDELLRALKFAGDVWGTSKPWAEITEADLAKLYQRRLKELLGKDTKGIRAAQITVSRLITAARWLQRTIPSLRVTPPPEKWKAAIVKHWESITGRVHDPELVSTPGFTVEEAQRILEQSTFDPRFELLMWIGMGESLGAVARATRKDLDSARGTLTLRGHFKKGSHTINLTAGQRVALDRALGQGGYLHEVEQRYLGGALKNYRLFPSGYVVGRVGLLRGKGNTLTLSSHVDFTHPVTGSWVRKNFRLAEQRAGVRHILGRGGFRLPLIGESRPAVEEPRAAIMGPADAPPDFAPLTLDPIMNEILQRRWVECVLCVRAQAHLAATVMMGGLLEALLLARAIRMTDKAPLFQSPSTPHDKETGKALELSKWTLASLIDVALDLKWLTPSAKDVAVVLRDYRNYVHPSKQSAHAVHLEVKDSQMFWDVTKHLARQLLDSVASP
jgi:hypothetical protein